MKTLKKVLAVVLALAMVLGMTVTASATFDDAAEIGADYKEAVDVMNAVGVFVGSNGKMNPKANLTRAEAAKLITYLLLGEDTAEALPVAVLFKDVDASNWANKYIAYLANEGVVAGVGAGKFNPAGKVTGYEFGKMLLGCLGYDATVEGLTGSNWAINTAKLLKTAGVVTTAMSKKAANALTREEAALYCLNALEATMVYYYGGSNVTINDVKITTNSTRYTAVYNDTNSPFDEIQAVYQQYGTIFGKATTLELGEHLYGQNLLPVDSVADKFGRTAIKWYYNGIANATAADKYLVGTYAQAADYTYLVVDTTTNTTSKVLKELGLEYAAAYTSVKYPVGTELEIFTNSQGYVTSVIPFTTSLAKVVNVVNVSSTKDYDYNVTLNIAGTQYSFADTKLDGFDATTMVKDAYVTFKSSNLTAGVVALATSKVSGKVEGYKAATLTKITVDGKAYTASGEGYWNINGEYATTDFTNSFDFYLDANDYIIGVERTTDINDTNIFFVVDSAFTKATLGAAQSSKIMVITLDGKIKYKEMVVDDSKVEINGAKKTLADAQALLNHTNGTAVNHFYAYTENEDGKIESLRVVGTNGYYGAAQGVLNTKEYIVNTTKVDFDVAKALVKVGSDNYYANSTTKTTLVKTDEAYSTVYNATTATKAVLTGYAKYENKDYTVGTDACGILVKYNNSSIEEIYVVGIDTTATLMASYDDAVYGYFVSSGNNYYNTTLKKTVYDVTFDVDGESKVYQMTSVPATANLYKIEVAEGIATAGSDGEVNNAVVTVVGDKYFVEATHGQVEVAATTKYYDATDLDTGITADTGLEKGDVVSYSVDTNGNAKNVYVTYANQLDGTIYKDTNNPEAFATYVEKVLGKTNQDAQGIIATTPANCYKEPVLIKWTMPAAASSKDAYIKVTDGEDTVKYTFTTGSWAKGDVKSLLLNTYLDYAPSFTNHEYSISLNFTGTTPFPEGTYTYEVYVDSIGVVLAGSFEVIR